LLALGKGREAAEQFRLALRLRPDLVEVYRNLGSALEAQGQFHEASRCYETALRLKPGFPEAHSQLADLLKKLGRFEEAVHHLRQALRLRPDYAFDYWNLSQFAAQGLCHFSTEETAHVQSLLKTGSLSLLESSFLHLVMGNLLDVKGSYDAAFSHYREGNTQRKEWLRQTGKAFDPAAHHELIERLRTTFDEAYFRKARRAASDSELPVFVVGMPRSGTTLVEQILSSHSQVAGADELPDMERLLGSLNQKCQPSSSYPECMLAMDGIDLRELAENYLASLKRIGGSAIRVIDKRPDNFLHLGLIAVMFPQARVIHCRRDPLDVCWSCYTQHFSRIDYSWSLEDLGFYYKEYERLMAHWQRVQPLRIRDVRYEDLVAAQETVSRELITFCGLEWERGCLEFYKNHRPVQTVSAVQVRKPMFTHSIGRWRKYAGHLEPLRKALGLPQA
jgi:tetratricopeptide (TPR) repeat protein